MAILQSTKHDDLLYYKPESLIAFYKNVAAVVSIETLISTFIRYEYEADEMYQVCEALNVSNQDFRKIRTAVYDELNPLAQSLNQNNWLHDQERVDKAWRHIHELHFRNDNYGYVIFGTPKPARYDGDKDSMWQFAINKKDLTKEIVAKLLTVSNLYITVNTSKSYARKTKEVGNINALYLDIDNVSDVDGFINKCLLEGRFKKLEPSRIISSGGGLHVYFYLDNAYANDKLNPYVTRMQKALHEIYPEADKLSDLVRYLRLEGSTYDKPQKPLKTVQSVYESDRVYNIGEIGPMLVPAYVAKDKPKKTEFYSFKKNSDGNNKLMKVPGVYRDLEVKRFRDLEYLASIGHFDSDRRKRAVYFYALFIYRATESFSQASTAAHNFNSSLKAPLSIAEVENQISSVAKNGKLWNYKRETVVSKLDITEAHLTEEQMSKLQALFPTEQKRGRDYKKRKQNRRNKKGLTEREASKNKTYEAIKTLLAQGYKQVQIVKKTGLSKSYVSEIVKQIKQESK